MDKNMVLKNLLRYLKSENERQEADAAVSILLKKRNIDIKILFVKRAEDPFDLWSGEMAFPGGRRDRADKDIKETIVRETFEETGIDLLSNCRFLGTMELFRSTRNKKMKILPFVIVIEHEPAIILNDELEWSIWIPLEDLILQEGTARIGSKEIPAFIVENCTIWGLTYRILKTFIHKMQPSFDDS